MQARHDLSKRIMIWTSA